MIGLSATAAQATITFDPATGTGFVGKGDVQLALGLNNAQLQNQASSLVFTYRATTSQETSWTCFNDKNENTQVRERVTTTTTSGLASVVAREKNQITGFLMQGYNGIPTISSESAGNKLESCPEGNWDLVVGSTSVGTPTVISGGLYINGVLLVNPVE